MIWNHSFTFSHIHTQPNLSPNHLTLAVKGPGPQSNTMCFGAPRVYIQTGSWPVQKFCTAQPHDRQKTETQSDALWHWSQQIALNAACDKTNLASQQPFIANDLSKKLASNMWINGTQWIIQQIYVTVLVDSTSQCYSLFLTSTQIDALFSLKT